MDFLDFRPYSCPNLNMFLTILDTDDTIFVSFKNFCKYLVSRATSRNASKLLKKTSEEAYTHMLFFKKVTFEIFEHKTFSFGVLLKHLEAFLEVASRQKVSAKTHD